ncbi:MAG: type IX secretion system membrane protein PorP/SprF [Sphingobacteriales bacterium]|nr:type IX secretion system membrane protein PorP/SprF [Sphingobacteriales bacterium]
MFVYLPNAPPEFQGGIRVEHSEVFWWELALCAKQGFILSAGVNLNKKFTIGYSFDIYKNPVSVFDNGSNAHEVLLRYNIFKQVRSIWLMVAAALVWGRCFFFINSCRSQIVGIFFPKKRPFAYPIHHC